MNVIQFNLRRFCACFIFVINILKRIFGRGRQRKSSRSADDNLPTSVAVDCKATGETAGEDQWEDWGKNEEFTVKVEPSSPPSEPSTEDLFQDMVPVIKKTKKIAIKKKALHPDPSHTAPVMSPSSRLNFDMRFTPAEPELGTWTEESNSVWDDEAVSEGDIELQTEKILKERKQAERDRRAWEQQRRKEEKEAMRMAKKASGHLGVRLST